jgi:hypothetical protein
MEVIMRTKTTLLAIFVIVTAIALVTAGSITASTLAVKKKSTVTTKKSIGSKKIKSPNTSTGRSATTTTTTTGTGNSTLGRTEHFSKFIICMRLLSGPLSRPNVDIVIILHMASVVLVASSDHFLMPAQYLVPYQKPVILDHLLVVAVQLLELLNDN